MTPSGIKPTTFRLVALCVNRATACPFGKIYPYRILVLTYNIIPREYELTALMYQIYNGGTQYIFFGFGVSVF
jgi:hypothetical protein